jgi:charged multivesicular body protein 7
VSRARLPALYSDFTSQRTLNPDGYAANVAAWKHGLASAVLAGRVPSRSANPSHFALELDETLLRALETKQLGQPLALGAVLAEAVANGEMMPRKQFLASRESIFHKSWSGLGWSAVQWGLRQTGLVGGPGNTMPRGQFVVLANLEDGAKAFDAAARDRGASSRFDRTFSLSHFRRAFERSLLPGNDQKLSDDDFELLTRFLSRDKGVLATDGHTVVRIRDSPAEDATITDEDRAVASLKALMEDLTRQTETLGQRIEALQASAQEAVRRKNTVAARAALKSRRLAEANLAKRFATLGQLEEVAAKIEQAADNVQFVSVMESSADALRGLNAKVGGLERVDAVLDNLREQMGEADEVGNVIAEGAGPVIDEAEVDDEFEALLAAERAREEEKERKVREAQMEREAEETRRRLAELEKLGPVADSATTGQKEEAKSEGNTTTKQSDPPTPVTKAAGGLERMSIEEEPVRLAAE